MDIKALNALLSKNFTYINPISSDTLAGTFQLDSNVIYTTFYVGSGSIQISLDVGDSEWDDAELEHYIDQYNSLFASQTGFKASQRYDFGKEQPQLVLDCVLSRKGSDEYSAHAQIVEAFRKLKGSGRALEYMSTFITYLRNK